MNFVKEPQKKIQKKALMDERRMKAQNYDIYIIYRNSLMLLHHLRNFIVRSPSTEQQEISSQHVDNCKELHKINNPKATNP